MVTAKRRDSRPTDALPFFELISAVGGTDLNNCWASLTIKLNFYEYFSLKVDVF
jgi:hypothetical protein